MAIAITEEFDSPTGQFTFYDATSTLTNYVPNPSFEANATGWGTSNSWFLTPGAVTLTRVTSTSQVGIASGKIVTPATSNTGIIALLGVLPAGTYSYSIYAKGEVGGETISLQSGQADGTQTGTNLTLTTNWQRMSSTFVSGGSVPSYICVRTTSAVARTFYVDGAMVVAGSTTPDYFDRVQSSPISVLDNLRHADIRTFTNEAVFVPLTMFTLSLPVSTLDTYTMTILESSSSTTEGWTVGTYGIDNTLGNLNTLRVPVNGTVTTTSAMTPVDLSVMGPTDEISVACPSFPASSLVLGGCSLKLKQGVTTVTLPFPTGLSNGSQELKWPLSALGSTLSPDTVQFVLQSSSSTTVKFGNLRVLSTAWTPYRLDMNTVRDRLEPILTRTGTIPTSNLPKMWRAADPPGEGADPMPIDARLAVNFFTGSQTSLNTIKIFLRGRREDFLTQLDIDGTDVNVDGIPEFGVLQAQLDDYGRQPDYGTAQYNSRPQIDLDEYTQSGLEVYIQAQLERVDDFISEAWIEVDLSFGTLNQFKIKTTESSGGEEVSLPFSLTANTHYLYTIDMEDDTIQGRIYALNSFGKIGSVVFDSSAIKNNVLIKRRKGRIGWELTLNDGDAYINSIRSRGLVYGEFISTNQESLTPVEGARLSTGATPDLVTVGSTIAINGSTVTLDESQTKSPDGSAKVVARAYQGVQSQPVIYEDFDNTEFTFDLFLPIAADSVPEAYLLSESGLFIPILMPTVVRDQWQTIRVHPTLAVAEQSGAYRFVLIVPSGNVTFWIDNLKIRQRSVAWYGRATLYDPWGRDNAWTNFRSLTDSETDGVLFPARGRFMQIRGKTLTQDATISRIYTKPKYAELGRLVWDIGRAYRS